LHLPFHEPLTPVPGQVLTFPLTCVLQSRFGDYMTLFMPTITHSAVFTWHSINILQECYASCSGLIGLADCWSLLNKAMQQNVREFASAHKFHSLHCCCASKASLTSVCVAIGGALCRQHVLDSGGG